MAYIPYTPVNIILEIPDLVIEGTIIKRKAKMITMIYNQRALTLTVAWSILHYADNAGQYGDYIGSIIADKLKETTADNEVIVNAQTGEIITDLSQYETIVIVDGEETIEYTIDWMGQYDWFNMIGETTPVIVHDLIRQYGQTADWFTNIK